MEDIKPSRAFHLCLAECRRVTRQENRLTRQEREWCASQMFWKKEISRPHFRLLNLLPWGVALEFLNSFTLPKMEGLTVAVLHRFGMREVGSLGQRLQRENGKKWYNKGRLRSEFKILNMLGFILQIMGVQWRCWSKGVKRSSPHFVVAERGIVRKSD